MRLRMSGVFLFVMALMSSCSTHSQSTDLHLGTVQAPTSSATHVVSSTSDPMTSTSTTVRAVTDVATTVPPSTVAATISIVASSPSTSEQAADPPAPSSTTTESTEIAPPIARSPDEVVEADYHTARQTAERCNYDPYGCDYSAIAVGGSPMDLQMHELVKVRTANNLRAVEGKGNVQLRIDRIQIEGTSAFVSICAYDTIVIYDVADPFNPDDDIIYNEDKDSYLVRWEMRQVDATWLLYAGKQSQRLDEGDLCGF